ncbi:hypothetical protein K458DRAFT_93727 [Lentithecium fluviatile CBS 122367]|uniref:Uncharacterized protein n=1 Tax=Lentithecium fluviatile CBS 122367 TaxID=1168545 RepID=A0A6G1IQ24_9PLEO|nr:hypothetical protein K458DRAFT_93727 [Lentithecium fluviatile CBS 122367]
MLPLLAFSLVPRYIAGHFPSVASLPCYLVAEKSVVRHACGTSSFFTSLPSHNFFFLLSIAQNDDSFSHCYFRNGEEITDHVYPYRTGRHSMCYDRRYDNNDE